MEALRWWLTASAVSASLSPCQIAANAHNHIIRAAQECTAGESIEKTFLAESWFFRRLRLLLGVCLRLRLWLRAAALRFLMPPRHARSIKCFKVLTGSSAKRKRTQILSFGTSCASRWGTRISSPERKCTKNGTCPMSLNVMFLKTNCA